jgi:hypothetical protein
MPLHELCTNMLRDAIGLDTRYVDPLSSASTVARDLSHTRSFAKNNSFCCQVLVPAGKFYSIWVVYNIIESYSLFTM